VANPVEALGDVRVEGVFGLLVDAGVDRFNRVVA
jgi:hypothetical protein